MSTEQSSDADAARSSAGRSRTEIEADIAARRDHLASSVEALAAKADVKSQAQHKADEAKMKAERAANEAKIKAAEARDLAAAQASQVKSRADALPTPVRAALVVAPVLIIVLILIRRARRGA